MYAYIEGEKLAPLTDSIPLVKEGGFSFDELRTMWKCSHAEGNNSEINQQILPEDISIEKTKWKSILTVEPKAFFKKFLSQYPGDTRATQPVLIFSHKPLNSFEEVTDICKVIDVAVVPDRPDVCVAITETYHDVASYHMLHAERQTDGSFTLAANSLEGRVLPSGTYTHAFVGYTSITDTYSTATVQSLVVVIVVLVIVVIVVLVVVVVIVVVVIVVVVTVVVVVVVVIIIIIIEVVVAAAVAVVILVVEVVVVLKVALQLLVEPQQLLIVPLPL